MIISFDNLNFAASAATRAFRSPWTFGNKTGKGKGTVQDTLALMSGMVPFRIMVVKERTGK